MKTLILIIIVVQKNSKTKNKNKINPPFWAHLSVIASQLGYKPASKLGPPSVAPSLSVWNRWPAVIWPRRQRHVQCPRESTASHPDLCQCHVPTQAASQADALDVCRHVSLRFPISLGTCFCYLVAQTFQKLQGGKLTHRCGFAFICVNSNCHLLLRRIWKRDNDRCALLQLQMIGVKQKLNWSCYWIRCSCDVAIWDYFIR